MLNGGYFLLNITYTVIETIGCLMHEHKL